MRYTVADRNWIDTRGTTSMLTGLGAPASERRLHDIRYRLYGGGYHAYGAPPRDAVTFWGRSCLYVDICGTGIVTDPVFDPRYSPLSKRLIGAPDPEHYGGARLILISHAHADHLSPRTLADFPEDALVLCPPRAARYLRDVPQEVRIMAPWENHAEDELVVHAVPARHAGGRYAVRSRGDGRALGFVICSQSGTIYYSGDTRYCEVFTDVGNCFAPDVAVLNVNVHLRGRDALRAARDLRPRRVIPAHHGAYISPASPAAARWRAELAAGLAGAYAELPVGGSLHLDASN
jgi:L-ascorbate metabolism protein UlaG (beta-lactamase superfamily)